MLRFSFILFCDNGFFWSIFRVNEYWDPIIPDLDQLVVKRKLPLIHICLSAEKLSDKDELG